MFIAASQGQTSKTVNTKISLVQSSLKLNHYLTINFRTSPQKKPIQTFHKNMFHCEQKYQTFVCYVWAFFFVQKTKGKNIHTTYTLFFSQIFCFTFHFLCIYYSNNIKKQKLFRNITKEDKTKSEPTKQPEQAFNN